MNAAPRPHDEAERLQVLQSLGALDRTADPALQGIVRCATALLDCPIALVSLVDAERQWFHARAGLAVQQTSREVSFCAHAILHDRPLVVPDATLDPRFADNPLVTGDLQLRAYAGVPLSIEGRRVGTLCVIDQRARSFGDAALAQLADLARAAEQLLVGARQRGELRLVAQYRQQLFDQMGDGVLLLDRQYRVLDANPSALEMLGHAHEDLPALRLHDLLAEDERQRLWALSPSSLGERPPLAEWHALRKDGSRFPAEVSVRPVDGGRFVAVVRDVSERHAQAQQLRELSVAVAQCAESVIITDPAGRIEYVNEAMVAVSGHARDELIGRNPSLLKSGRTPAATFRGLWANLKAGRPWRGLLFNRAKDGREFTVFAIITPVRQPTGEVTQYIAVLEDVTEKRRMGEELDRHRHRLEELVEQRTQELEHARRAAEQASEAKSAFLATMSHEIRTPMSGVVGILDVLRQSSLTPYQSELTDTIRESSLALLGIIDDILDFSKAQAGALHLAPEPVDLQRLIEGVCDTLQPLASQRGVRLQVFVDPALPPWIHSDPLRLRQILNNLLGNAIKFSSGLDRTGEVRLRCLPEGPDQFCLRISDNGIGVASAAQDQIFEPFIQGDRLTTRRYGGTGLGLSICRRLVELFGGRIALEQDDGPGATFSVLLPLQAADVVARPDPDLDGLDCDVCLRDPVQARDWCTYLAAAGARARAWTDLARWQSALDAEPTRRPVLLLETGLEDDRPGEVRWPPGVGGRSLPLVRVGRGQRRHARLLEPGRVAVDADPMHRLTLLEAVALAAGRQRPAPAPMPLDAAGPPLPEASEPDLDAAAREGRVVLVAEDNEINRTVIRHQLARLGFAAEVADGGADALARWREQPTPRRYGLLLTDLNMPDIDGYALVAAIRADEGDRPRLPVVALTANALADEAERCLAAGMDGYLSKPVDLVRLGETVAQWLPAPAAEADSEVAVADEAPARAGDPGRGEPQVLLVDDEPGELALLERQLEQMGAPRVETCRSATLALQWLQQRDTSATLLLLDLNMPGMDGVEFMRHLADRRFAGTLALVSAADTRVLETATKLAEAYQLHVLSHLHKPVPAETLRTLIDRWRGYVPTPAHARGRPRSAEEIRHAITHNELLLHYQPKVAIDSGEVTGVEALVRWQHPRDGLCYPDSFVASAEASGLIDALTRTVMTQALAQLRRWRDRGLPLKLAINVSMDNLARLDFPEFVLAEIDRHGVPATDLVLEVTESRLMRDARSTMDILTRLRLKRIGLSIDDFGTGHSSLAQLRDIPFDELKIDRGFVHGGREQPTQRAIFAASVDMAHQLGMSAVAEGVEDRADWDFVRGAGCDVAQGYFIARPMPAAALPEWVAQWRERYAAL